MTSEAAAVQSEPLRAPEVAKPLRPLRLVEGGGVEEMQPGEALTEGEVEVRYAKYQDLDAGKPILGELQHSLDEAAKEKIAAAAQLRQTIVATEAQIEASKQEAVPAELTERVSFIISRAERNDALAMNLIPTRRDEVGLRFDAHEAMQKSAAIRQGLEFLDRGEVRPEFVSLVSDQIAYVEKDMDALKSHTAEDPSAVDQLKALEAKHATLTKFSQRLHEMGG